MKKLIVLLGCILVQNAYSDSLQTDFDSISISNFSQLISLIRKDSLGPIQLSEVSAELGVNGAISKSKSTSVEAIVAVSTNPQDSSATVSLYLADNDYTKIGESYQSALSKLTNLATSLGLTASTDEFEECPVSTDCGVTWTWTADGFSCRLAITNGQYYGGDVFYECSK